MRAAINLYEHPEFSASEASFKQLSMKQRIGTVVGALSVAAASTFAVCKWTSLGKTLQDSSFVQMIIQPTSSSAGSKL